MIKNLFNHPLIHFLPVKLKKIYDETYQNIFKFPEDPDKYPKKLKSEICAQVFTEFIALVNEFKKTCKNPELLTSISKKTQKIGETDKDNYFKLFQLLTEKEYKVMGMLLYKQLL